MHTLGDPCAARWAAGQAWVPRDASGVEAQGHGVTSPAAGCKTGPISPDRTRTPRCPPLRPATAPTLPPATPTAPLAMTMNDLSRPPTPSLVHSPSTARSSFSSREPRPPPPPRLPSWSKRHASLDSPRERPTVVPAGSLDVSALASPTTVDAALAGPPPPQPPHIHTPPSSPSARPYEYPFLPANEPRGEDRPSVSVDVKPDQYNLVCRMPHFHHSSITVATRRGRLLVIAADRWDTDPAPFSLDPAHVPAHPPPAHFERRITFGWDADMARIRAEFDGQVLHVSVPRRQISHTMGLPRPSHGTAHPNRASAPGMDVGAYASMDIVPPELEMTRTQSAGWSSSAPTRRDVAWPLG